ncbi:receptor-interacting serine/threonine-protein kinase 2-like [Amphiura filiformis]|uniref:receptor-interacting serine/threonine-protein kinase 2-like n=1 Tax=Amphiura filiformis TaxID=82378 RepID=UPI003B21BF70
MESLHTEPYHLGISLTVGMVGSAHGKMEDKSPVKTRPKVGMERGPQPVPPPESQTPTGKMEDKFPVKTRHQVQMEGDPIQYPHLSLRPPQKDKMASTSGPGLTLINFKDITLGKVLGVGGFGAVYKAKHVNWGHVAVKRLTGVSLTADVQKEADRMFRVVSSPYLVRIMGLIKNPGDIGIVMEFFENGSLKEFEKKYMKCDCWSRKVKMVQDIAFGMNYLHTLNPPIIHRDLKLENVFVDNAFDAKVCYRFV